jgi:serine/threonine-protein kinase RsbW
VVSELTAVSTFESRVESIDDAEEFVRRFSKDAGFEESDQYFIGLAAREVVINAMKHGNRFDRNKKVGIRLSKDSHALTIEVSDEGDGFLMKDVPDPRKAENQERRSGRGITMASAIMDEFFIEKHEPHGTHIRMIKHFGRR